jgi:ankyrin repeat protein
MGKKKETKTKSDPSILSDDHPVFAAAVNGDIEFFKEYLASGGSVDAQSESNPPIAGTIVFREHNHLLELLLNYGLDINKSFNSFDEPLHFISIRERKLTNLKFLVEKGADIHRANRYKMNALHVACGVGDLEIVQYLINAGANVESLSQGARTPLLTAAGDNHLHIVRYLVESAGANLAAKSSSGEDILMHATTGGRTEIVKYLLEKGLDPNSKDSRNVSLVEQANRNGHSEVVKILQEAIARPKSGIIARLKRLFR